MRFCVAQRLVALLLSCAFLRLACVARERRLRGLELDGERAGVDLDEEVALLDVLALLERTSSIAPVDLGLDRDGVEGRDVPEALEPDGHVALRDGRP